MRTFLIKKKIEDCDFLEKNFCDFLENHIKPDSVIKLPNTEELYKNDAVYRKLVKNYSTAKRLMGEYVNKMNV